MYNPVEGGHIAEIEDNAFGFVFKCWVPPVGKGVNVMNGKLHSTDIIKRSEIPEEQYWERPTLPSDYNAKRKKEVAAQKTNPSFIDPYLENIRRREWNRRLCGVWFWNNGKLEYITGAHYFYLTYWKFQGKWNDFRRPDQKYWYIIRYIEDDEFCLGGNEITKRKNGKTARAGCFLYERTSRLKHHHGGIQSKTDEDAEEVFKKAVIHPWQKLPHFFRPVFDLSKGTEPGDELRFFPQSKRGFEAADWEAIPSLESFVDYKSSAESAYDGPELHTYVSDEAGKTKKPVSILERQNTVRYCTEIDGVFKGKHLYTTTVEIEKDKKTGADEEDNYEFQEMTAKSNPLDRNENGRTTTGLYTFFLPAHHAMFFDIYGEPDIERATVFLLNTRKKLQEEGDTRGLSSFKRKNPMTFKEAFSIDGANSLYDPELLDEQLGELMWKYNLTEKGNLEWIDKAQFTIEKIMPNGEKQWVRNNVEWKADEKGKFEKIMGWWPRDANKVVENNGQYLPNNNFAIRIGCDPFKYDKTKNKRRSNCAAFAYQIPDPIFPDPRFDDTFVLRYAYRENSTRLANMDILKMAWWCGCQVLFERNVNHWKEHFNEWKCGGFLMWLPGEVEPGIYANPDITQQICNYTEQFINEHIKKVYFKTLIRKETGWLGFKVEDTEKFDEPMGAGYTLIAVRGKKYNRTHDQRKDIESILPLRKAI